MHTALAVVLSYIIGSVPAAYMAGKSRGIDLRRHGSGNLGATNVVRTLGWRVGLLVFAFDVAKGALPVLLFPQWTHGRPSRGGVAIFFGDAAITASFLTVLLYFGNSGTVVEV